MHSWPRALHSKYPRGDSQRAPHAYPALHRLVPDGDTLHFYELAELAAFTQVVPKVHLSTAVAQNEAVFSTVSLLAPSLGGVLLSVGKAFPFVADRTSYL